MRTLEGRERNDRFVNQKNLHSGAPLSFHKNGSGEHASGIGVRYASFHPCTISPFVKNRPLWAQACGMRLSCT